MVLLLCTTQAQQEEEGIDEVAGAAQAGIGIAAGAAGGAGGGEPNGSANAGVSLGGAAGAASVPGR
ncbi:GH15997 [Drosophila grimshawi]|uniref:GH15997 n=2 Tax=Drosophila grimshawi TaxID=7222 RepID=B4J2B3_DROGR|nr:GH15997 [Drosophila grimshawi]